MWISNEPAGNKKAPCVVGATKGAKISGKKFAYTFLNIVLPWTLFVLVEAFCVLITLGGVIYG